PLVLVFEDLHWADDGLLDFVDQLVDWAREAPLLVLCTARPELLERRPGWGGGKANASTISLPPLEDDETARLFSALLQRAVLPAETQSVLLAHAAGNPLYAEQYARMLLERGEGEELPLPETVQGIIAARLDGLSGAEKSLLQDASVVGKVFWLGAVSAIGGVDRFAAEEALHGLERKELVQRARRSSVEGDTEYAFRHLLVRDVAYGQIPRAARADKHEGAAVWIETLGRSEDQAEMLVHHYVSALEYLRAAGRDAAHLLEPARLALRDAGDRAASLHAWPAAARFYTEALELWPPDDVELAHLRFRCGNASFNTDGSGLDLLEASADELQAAGDVDAAATAALAAARAYWVRGDIDRHVRYLGRAFELVADRPESPARVAVLAAQAAKHLYDGEFEQVLGIAAEALPLAERLGRGDVRVRLLELRGFARTISGDAGGLDDFAQAIALASEIHAFDQLHSAYNNSLGAQVALGEVQAAWDIFALMSENAERHPTDNRRRWIRIAKAELFMIEGNWSEASRIVENALAEAKAATPHYSNAIGLHVRALIRLAMGDVAGGSADTAEALELARRSSDGQLVAPALVYRAFALIDEGRHDDAATLAAEGLEFGELLPRVLTDAPIVWAGWVMYDLSLSDGYAALLESTLKTPWVLAALEITRGDFRGAADVLEEMGYRTGEAYARLRAAKQLVEAGRRAEADEQLHRALAFYREVGATRYVREGEALLAASA
ncbi:MAG: hypothetical protein M3R39_04410, partial [Actinomycetota bacterium]|nr:hypothetical protein [Actinomycetota bacterium]